MSFTVKVAQRHLQRRAFKGFVLRFHVAYEPLACLGPKDVKSFEVCADDSPKPRNVPEERLKEGWEEYSEKFNEHINKWIMAELTEEKLTREIVGLAMGLRKYGGVGSPEVKQKVPELLAGIFALYAILKSGKAYASASSRADAVRTETEALEPHTEALQPQEPNNRQKR